MRLVGLLAVVTWLVVACTPGHPTYTDKVRSLEPTAAHAVVRELLPLLGDSRQNPDDLVRTWKEFVGSRPLPLQEDHQLTFVYYDFTHRLAQVFLEASFAPDRREPLVRWKDSGFFYRVYEVPRVDRLEYRFSDGTAPLIDPFRADVDPDGLWHRVPDWTRASAEWIVGASEPLLAGQDLVVVLPPGYHRNLGETYDLVVAVSPPEGWAAEALQAQKERPFPVILVGVATPTGGTWTASLKPLLEERVVPWTRARYRASALPADLTLAAWGPAVVAARDIGRPDFWNRIQTPATGVPAFLESLFPVETP